ncbi:MAG: CAF17-like 4Fe-4S cluster assembly/insertion protein YgfZ [Gemmatimonadaceae bacterium]
MNQELASRVEPVSRAYAALRNGALVLELHDRTRGLFQGPKAAEVLNGLVTNDLLPLQPGEGAYAAALTPKGKIIADVRVFRRDADLLVDASPAAAAGLWAMIRKYVNPRLSRYEDVSTVLGDVSVFGPAAGAIVARVTGVKALDLALYSHRTADVLGAPVTVARVPDAGVDGFTLFAPNELGGRLRQALIDTGAVAGVREAFHITRVEAGRPFWGVDMDDGTLAQEARMDELNAISYTKGCYTGQETVARVHFRGHVNRLLQGLRFPDDPPVPPGTPLVRDDDTGVGTVKSSVTSPRLGPIALAIVRREVSAGTTLWAHLAHGPKVPALLSELPFEELLPPTA